RPVTTASVRIVDPDGPIDQEVRDGEIGEIVLQSPSLAAGYLHKPELTKEKFSDSWWRSGDLGLRDENGILFVKGRTDNQINSGGVKVRAEEIENILLQHTDISHAAVVGEPDVTWGERIVAHVVSRSADLTEHALLKNLKDEDLLPHRLVPKAVHFHAQLPRGATGKLYRRGLRRHPK
ncbi:MAG: fatty acid--CoA ligase family protein, partial [Rhodospirillales bacterium]|nr:fatty acid--CoA ligase family protein [Rhodospirillales bacterium]